MECSPQIPDADEEAVQSLWALVNAEAPKILVVTLPSSRGVPLSNESQTASSDDAAQEDTEDFYDNPFLVGRDNDPIIPSTAQIKSIWNQGIATWTSFVQAAEPLPLNRWPSGVSEPSSLLHDIPKLPLELPRHKLSGQPVWSVSHIEDATREILGATKHFYLSYPEPVLCHISSLPPLGNSPRGLSLLTVCWSYILSVRLLELQKRRIYYSQEYTKPKLRNHSTEKVAIDLPESVSPGICRWLCALLSQKPGWTTDKPRDFPPWTPIFSESALLVIRTTSNLSFDGCTPPSSKEACEYLIQLCHWYGLGPEEPVHPDGSEAMSPSTAGFLAALMLPFCRIAGLQPQLSAPSLGRANVGSHSCCVRREITRQYGDLPYYMTLSLDPPSVGSMLWSIFWQPEVQCNLVSPWLSSILHVIRPIMESKDLLRLGKVFACRRPRVALLWLGIFFLGDPVILDQVQRYLEFHEERPWHGSLSAPDLVVSAWTGSPQSFWDEKEQTPPDSDFVTRADILRRRHNFRLHEDHWTLFAWQPFGDVARTQLEPELVEYLRRPYFRRYKYWVWLNAQDHTYQSGFRMDTKRLSREVPDHLEICPVMECTSPCEVFTIPSKQATLSMLHHSVQNMVYDRSLCISAIPRLRQDHEWLQDWRGLESN